MRRPHTLLVASLCLLLGGLSAVTWLRGDDPPAAAQTEPTAPTAKEALVAFNDLIGGWRGTGQPRRGSAQGAWREDAEWVWEFGKDKGDIAIRYDVKDGKLLKSARLTYDANAKQYLLTATTPDEESIKYAGQIEGDKLTLVSEPDKQGQVHRLTVTKLNEKRTLVLHEKRAAAQQSFLRVAEVGYTREGTRLAFDGTTGPECIVTGGAGTISVSYKGKTYSVCCTGCRQAFEDDPEGVLADAAERHAKERQEREQAGVK
jgi:YHS domain-containing protein